MRWRRDRGIMFTVSSMQAWLGGPHPAQIAAMQHAAAAAEAESERQAGFLLLLTGSSGAMTAASAEPSPYQPQDDQ